MFALTYAIQETSYSRFYSQHAGSIASVSASCSGDRNTITKTTTGNSWYGVMNLKKTSSKLCSQFAIRLWKNIPLHCLPPTHRPKCAAKAASTGTGFCLNKWM